MVKMVNGERRDESVAIAIDRDKGSQAALKWAVDNLLTPGETLTLVHVRVKQTLANNGNPLMPISTFSNQLCFKFTFE